MKDFIIILFAIIESAGIMAWFFLSLAKRRNDLRKGVESLKTQLKEKQDVLANVKEMIGQLVDLSELKNKGRDLRIVKESLKTERGRITITQAELETVEGRLRELEEIDRELEAAGLEAKEELNILKKKEKELLTKNDLVKEQIKLSTEQMNDLMGKLKLNSESEAQVQQMQTDLLNTQQQIDTLLGEIEKGNDRYFSLKRRYDALDIEYAQLFEKFSEAEAMAGKSATQES